MLKRRWIWVVGLLLAVAAAAGWGGMKLRRYALQEGWIRFNKYDIRSEGILQVGDPAPDLELTRLDGESKSKLSDLYREKPLVLIFGSYT